jgi:hypothetical protein
MSQKTMIEEELFNDKNIDDPVEGENEEDFEEITKGA